MNDDTTPSSPTTHPLGRWTLVVINDEGDEQRVWVLDDSPDRGYTANDTHTR